MPPKAQPPEHLTSFVDNVGEVQRLVDIHAEIAGKGPGRKSGVEVLNKSAIVLVVACWEAYVEDAASAALKHMNKHGKDHTIFPKLVLERVGGKHSGLNAWALAGEGWKKALSDNLTEVLAKTTGALNTPRADQVDELFLKTVGLSKLSDSWAWSGRSSRQSVAALDRLITLRGSIAHRVKHHTAVRKSDVEASVDLVSRLAAKTNNHVGTYIHALTGVGGWGTFSYKGTS